MYRLIGGKSTGKTSNLMLLAKEKEAIINFTMKPLKSTRT